MMLVRRTATSDSILNKASIEWSLEHADALVMIAIIKAEEHQVLVELEGSVSSLGVINRSALQVA